MKKFLFYMLIIALCSCSDSFEAEEQGVAKSNTTIYQLIKKVNPDGELLLDDIVFEGVVTTSDSASNFYNSFIINDHTGAIEIMCGFYDIHDTYKLGGRVIVKAKGMKIARAQFGIWQLGLGASSERKVEYIGHRAIAARYLTFIPEYCQLNILERGLKELRDEDLGRMVSIKGLRSCAPRFATWVEEGSQYDGVVKFVDSSNDTIRVKTSRYATFARDEVPIEEVSLTGILLRDAEYLENSYYIRMNDENGVQVY